MTAMVSRMTSTTPFVTGDWLLFWIRGTQMSKSGKGNTGAGGCGVLIGLTLLNAVDFAWCDTVVMERKALQ